MSNLVAIAYPDRATADEVVAHAGPPPEGALDRARGRGRRHPRAGRQGQAAPDEQARGRRRRRRRAVGRADRPDLLRPAARHGGRRGDGRGHRRAHGRRRRRQVHEGPRGQAAAGRRRADRARPPLDAGQGPAGDRAASAATSSRPRSTTRPRRACVTSSRRATPRRSSRAGEGVVRRVLPVDLDRGPHPDETVVFEGHPSWRAVLSFYIGGVAGALVIAVDRRADREHVLGVRRRRSC